MRLEEMIRLENVSFSYGVDVEPALRDVSLSLPRGASAAIIGPNGGGKSTLMKLILGMLSPTVGTVELFGDAPEKTRYRVGYAPQQARVDFHFPITVLDVTLAGRFGAGRRAGSSGFFPRFRQADKEIALDALERMGIADLRRRSFGDLSGGQRQRVLIARALCAEPELLVLDEPTNNLDPASMNQFYELLKSLGAKTAILMATHDVGVVPDVFQSVVCVNQTAVTHPTANLTGELVRDLYHNPDLRLVRHDLHCCSECEHTHVEH